MEVLIARSGLNNSFNPQQPVIGNNYITDDLCLISYTVKCDLP